MDICIIGLPKAGKTSIVKVIFNKLNPKQTKMLDSTSRVQSYDLKIQNLQFKFYDFPGDYDLNQAPPNQQMILEGAYAIIFVISAQQQPFNDAFEMLYNMHNYIQKSNSKCSFHIFLHKAEKQTFGEQGRKNLKNKTKSQVEQYIKVKNISYYLTTIYDYSIFDAVSRVVQKVLPSTPFITRLLNQFCADTKIQKVFLFELLRKVYIATNTEEVDSVRYEICSQMIDIFLDISFWHTPQLKSDENNIGSVIRIHIGNQPYVLLLRCVDNLLAVVCIIKEDSFDQPANVDHNIDAFKKGLFEMLQLTSTLKI